MRNTKRLKKLIAPPPPCPKADRVEDETILLATAQQSISHILNCITKTLLAKNDNPQLLAKKESSYFYFKNKSFWCFDSEATKSFTVTKKGIVNIDLVMGIMETLKIWGSLVVLHKQQDATLQGKTCLLTYTMHVLSLLHIHAESHNYLLKWH